MYPGMELKPWNSIIIGEYLRWDESFQYLGIYLWFICSVTKVRRV